MKYMYYVCDACGKEYYDSNEFIESENNTTRKCLSTYSITVNANELEYSTIDSFRKSNKPYAYKIDLCPDCAKDIHNYLLDKINHN